jgi:hypothetical protein
MEKVTAVTVSASNILIINFSLGGVFYVTPYSSTNFTIQLTNVNPASSSYTTCIVTLLINTTNYKAHGYNYTINSTTPTAIIFSGGLTNVSITSATLVQQTLAIVYCGSSSTPVAAISSVVSFYA